MPLLTSPEWADLHLGEKDGKPIRLEGWLGKTIEEQCALLEELNLLHRRRPVSEIPEELGEGAEEQKLEIPPECEEGETERPYVDS